MSFLLAFRFDGKIFVKHYKEHALQEKGESKHQDKSAKNKNLLKITKFRPEVTFKHYSYLEEVLNYICALVPNNVKGEISEG